MTATETMLIDSIVRETKVEPRQYQRRITSKASMMFSGHYADRAGVVYKPARSVMIESPTGSGKTVMGLLTAKQMQVNPLDFGCDTLHIAWVAMRRNLLKQAGEENREKEIQARIDFVSMFAKEIPERLLHVNRNPRTKVLLVVDECQHDAADTMGTIHARINPEYTLGLSATPFRTDRVKLCFERIIKDAGIHQLIADGYLSQFDHYTIPVWNPVEVARFYLRERERWGKSLFFFHTLEQCQLFRDTLKGEGGEHSEIVTANSDRESQLDAFEAGEYDALSNMAILTEGFDCPALKTVWCRPSMKGPTIQMAGRVLRKHEPTGRKQIVQCQRTKFPMLKCAAPILQYTWQDSEWRSLQINPHIAEITRATLKKMLTAKAEMPAWIIKNRGKSRSARANWENGTGHSFNNPNLL